MADEQAVMRLAISDDGDVGYLSLARDGRGKARRVAKTLSLRGLIGEYSGPDIHLDFSDDAVLVGIEIVE
ncbi:MAG: DUF2283 domain-containing protein [Myxococcota bacterium]